MELEPVWKSFGMTGVMKVDFKNAFNLVSRDAVLQECANHFPDLLPWVAWCYGSHPFLWHTMGQLTSQSGVQQGDPLGPFLFALVLHKVAGAIKEDSECSQLLYLAFNPQVPSKVTGFFRSVLQLKHLLN